MRIAWIERVTAATKAEELVKSLPDAPARVLQSTVDREVFGTLAEMIARCADAGYSPSLVRSALADAVCDLAPFDVRAPLTNLDHIHTDDAIAIAQATVCDLEGCVTCDHLDAEEYCPAVQASLYNRRCSHDLVAEPIDIPDAIEIHLEITTRKRLPAIWESGGAVSDRSGAATLVAHPDGNSKRPTWITRGADACGNHSLFVVNEGDLVCKAWRSGETIGIGIYEIALISRDTALIEARYRCTGGAWDLTPPQYLLPLARAAKEKVTCLHCCDTHWAATL